MHSIVRNKTSTLFSRANAFWELRGMRWRNPCTNRTRVLYTLTQLASICLVYLLLREVALLRWRRRLCVNFMCLHIHMHHAPWVCVNAACISCYAINTIHSELTFFYLSVQHRYSKGRKRETFRFVMERALTSVCVYVRNYPHCKLLSHLSLLHDEAQSAWVAARVLWLCPRSGNGRNNIREFYMHPHFIACMPIEV